MRTNQFDTSQLAQAGSMFHHLSPGSRIRIWLPAEGQVKQHRLFQDAGVCPDMEAQGLGQIRWSILPAWEWDAALHLRAGSETQTERGGIGASGIPTLTEVCRASRRRLCLSGI